LVSWKGVPDTEVAVAARARAKIEVNFMALSELGGRKDSGLEGKG
jgi:hypothetical protein